MRSYIYHQKLQYIIIYLVNQQHIWKKMTFSTILVISFQYFPKNPVPPLLPRFSTLLSFPLSQLPPPSTQFLPLLQSAAPRSSRPQPLLKQQSEGLQRVRKRYLRLRRAGLPNTKVPCGSWAEQGRTTRAACRRIRRANRRAEGRCRHRSLGK